MPFVIIGSVIIIIIAVFVIMKIAAEKKYKELEYEVLTKLKFSSWNVISRFDEQVIVKSRQTLENYDDVKFFKENPEKLVRAKKVLSNKNQVATILQAFLAENNYKTHPQYDRLVIKIRETLAKAAAFRICVKYISTAGNHLGTKEISVTQQGINKFEKDCKGLQIMLSLF